MNLTRVGAQAPARPFIMIFWCKIDIFDNYVGLSVIDDYECMDEYVAARILLNQIIRLNEQAADFTEPMMTPQHRIVSQARTACWDELKDLGWPFPDRD